MKKVLVICISSVLALSALCGCASSAPAAAPAAKEEAVPAAKEEASPVAKEEAAPAKDKYVIKGTLQDMSNEFMVMLKNAMDERVKDMPDVELNILDGEGSPEKQVSQIENFIAEGVDAIILCPQDGTALVPAVREAIDAGIPVIMCSADVDEQVGQVLVGSNHKDAGIMQAEYVADQLGGKGKIAYLRGPIGHFAEVQRAEGTMEIFEKYPDIEIVFDQTGEWDRDKGMSLMETWLQTDTAFDCVMSQNDEMVLGAVQALEAAGKNDEILSTGMDAIDDALQAIKDGRLDSTIFQDAAGQGAGALEVAYDAAQGKEVSERVIPWALVTKENVDEFMK